MLRWKEVTVLGGDKVVLNESNGFVKKNQVLAVMGHSGSGKTSLLSFLAGFLPSASGIISVSPSNALVGYVGFESTLFPYATVRETFNHILKLHSPRMDSETRSKRLLEMAVLLSLQDCLDTKVISISSGEQKRVDIGSELLREPEFLLLDEPLSTLDAFSALQMMGLIRSLSTGQGIGVIVSVHQPRDEVFALFDTLLYIAESETLFFGPKERVRSQIDSYYTYPFQGSPHDAEYILDVVGHRRSLPGAREEFARWSKKFREEHANDLVPEAEAEAADHKTASAGAFNVESKELDSDSPRLEMPRFALLPEKPSSLNEPYSGGWSSWNSALALVHTLHWICLIFLRYPAIRTEFVADILVTSAICSLYYDLRDRIQQDNTALTVLNSLSLGVSVTSMFGLVFAYVMPYSLLFIEKKKRLISEAVFVVAVFAMNTMICIYFGVLYFFLYLSAGFYQNYDLDRLVLLFVVIFMVNETNLALINLVHGAYITWKRYLVTAQRFVVSGASKLPNLLLAVWFATSGVFPLSRVQGYFYWFYILNPLSWASAAFMYITACGFAECSSSNPEEAAKAVNVVNPAKFSGSMFLTHVAAELSFTKYQINYFESSLSFLLGVLSAIFITLLSLHALVVFGEKWSLSRRFSLQTTKKPRLQRVNSSKRVSAFVVLVITIALPIVLIPERSYEIAFSRDFKEKCKGCLNPLPDSMIDFTIKLYPTLSFHWLSRPAWIAPFLTGIISTSRDPAYVFLPGTLFYSPGKTLSNMSQLQDIFPRAGPGGDQGKPGSSDFFDLKNAEGRLLMYTVSLFAPQLKKLSADDAALLPLNVEQELLLLHNVSLAQAVDQGLLFSNLLLDRDTAAAFTNLSSEVSIVESYVLLVKRPDNSSPELETLALQLHGPSSPWLLKSQMDSWCWEIARLQFRNFISIFPSLKHTSHMHAIYSVFVLSSYRSLSKENPVFRILRPHLSGTPVLDANAFVYTADTNPVAPLAGMSQRSYLNLLKFLSRDYSFFEFTDTEALFTLLGLENPDQDGLEIPLRKALLASYKAVRKYIKDYVDLFFQSDEDVLSDTELQSWKHDLTAEDRGGIRNLTASSRLWTKNDLEQVLSGFFMTLVGHSFAHSALAWELSYIPFSPWNLLEYKTLTPSSQCTSSEMLELFGNSKYWRNQLTFWAGVPVVDSGHITGALGHFSGGNDPVKDAQANLLFVNFVYSLEAICRDPEVLPFGVWQHMTASLHI